MAVQLILSTDKLQSGFRAKYNATANTIIVSILDNGDGTAKLSKFDTSFFTLDFTTSFYTKAQIIALLSTITVGILVTGSFDTNNEYDASGDGLPEFPNATVYDVNGLQSPAQYDNTNKKIVGGNASEAFTAKFR